MTPSCDNTRKGALNLATWFSKEANWKVCQNSQIEYNRKNQDQKLASVSIRRYCSFSYRLVQRTTKVPLGNGRDFCWFWAGSSDESGKRSGGFKNHQIGNLTCKYIDNIIVRAVFNANGGRIQGGKTHENEAFSLFSSCDVFIDRMFILIGGRRKKCERIQHDH